MLETVLELDKELFIFINSHYNQFADSLMIFASNRFVWLPLYIVLLILAIRIYPKRVVLLLASVALMVIATDQVSVLIKKSTLRSRPCHNELLMSVIHTPDGCGGLYGFVSSHAANTFGIALFLGLFFHNKFKWLKWVLLSWAAFISYSRIYLGAHYPGDVIGGALLGLGIASIIYMIYQKLKAKFIHD